MEIMQSFIYSISRVKLGLYEQRILLKIVEHAQSRIKGVVIKNHLEQWQHDFDNVQMMIPIKDLLSDGSQHYAQVREAASSLERRIFEYQDSQKKGWFSTPVIYNVHHDARSGVIKFYVARRLFDIILDFTKGFRQYNLETALTLSSPYASRLYALMCGQASPLRLEIAELKRMFGVEAKYSQTADFIKKVIEPSRRCLDDRGCTSFTFSRVKKGQKVVALTFFPVVRDEKTKAQKLAPIGISLWLSKEMKIYLMQLGGFSLRELSSHKAMIDEFSKLPSCVEAINDILNRAQIKGMNKGYIINAMRSEVEEFRKKNVSE